MISKERSGKGGRALYPGFRAWEVPATLQLTSLPQHGELGPGKPAYLWLLSPGRQAGCPGTCPHTAPLRPHAKPTPESGQEQQSRGLPTAHILPSLLCLLQQETRPLTAWQNSAYYPYTTLTAPFGDRHFVLQFPPSAPSTTAEAARDLYKHPSDHIPGPYICCLSCSVLQGPS